MPALRIAEHGRDVRSARPCCLGITITERRDCRVQVNTYIRGRFSPESPAPTSVPPSPDTPTEVGPSYQPQLWPPNGATEWALQPPHIHAARGLGVAHRVA